MTQFIKYEELLSDVTDMTAKLPSFDAVIGIPRSGIIPATIMALHWNVPVFTPTLFLKRESLGSGVRLQEAKPIKRVLVIDDSHFTGASINEAAKMLGVEKDVEFRYAAVYSSDKNHKLDYCYRYVPQPRFFEWNWLHHDYVSRGMCFDMDGVLCVAPTREQNDYGPFYEQFLKNTKPLYKPTVPIRAIITGRIEKYRPQTERWLKEQDIKYEVLIMRPDRNIPIAKHKSEHYAAMKDCGLFVENEEELAKQIFLNTEKPVLDITKKVIYQ